MAQKDDQKPAKQLMHEKLSQSVRIAFGIVINFLAELIASILNNKNK